MKPDNALALLCAGSLVLSIGAIVIFSNDVRTGDVVSRPVGPDTTAAEAFSPSLPADAPVRTPLDPTEDVVSTASTTEPWPVEIDAVTDPSVRTALRRWGLETIDPAVVKRLAGYSEDFNDTKSAAVNNANISDDQAKDAFPKARQQYHEKVDGEMRELGIPWEGYEAEKKKNDDWRFAAFRAAQEGQR